MSTAKRRERRWRLFSTFPVLNRKIAEACEALGLKCVDLFSETSEAGTHLLDSRFSSDGLHFNADGYEVFARLVWRCLLATPFGGGPPRC